MKTSPWIELRMAEHDDGTETAACAALEPGPHERGADTAPLIGRENGHWPESRDRCH
jgi:hypothetical protein